MRRSVRISSRASLLIISQAAASISAVSWQQLLDDIYACDKCRLCAGRQNAVPGEGDAHAKLMFIGEGPGHDEDVQGRPFVGRSGELLNRMIAAIGLTREQAYICNIVKCRPPQNRNPEPDEAQACLPYLRAQVALVRPKIIVLLGKVACRYTLNQDISVMRDHGKWFERKGVWFMPTYHPSALLRDPTKKRDAWEDFQKIRDKLSELEMEKDT